MLIKEKISIEEFDDKSYQYLMNYIQSLDRVKQLHIQDFCPETAKYLQISG